jgi:hypothetical protein
MRKLLLVGAWVAMIVIGLTFLKPLRQTRPPDFMPFYFAGKLAASGQISQIYHRPAYQPLIAELRATGEHMHPLDAHYFIRPAFQAYFYIPFTLFSYPAASRLAIFVNLVLLAVLIWKLPAWFPVPVAVRPWMAGFLPFLWSVGIGQDTLLLTLMVAYSLHLAGKGQDVEAGLLLGLAVYKPHLVWLLPVALLASGRRKMVCSFLAVACSLAALSFAAVGPAGVREYLELVRRPSSDFLPETMGNVRALGLQWGTAAGVAAALLVVVCFGIVIRKGSWHARTAAALFTALLLSPHTYCQDYSLAALAALLLGHPTGLYLLLLPWPYFYQRDDMVPWVLLALGFLVTVAARPFAARWWNNPAPACSPTS